MELKEKLAITAAVVSVVGLLPPLVGMTWQSKATPPTVFNVTGSGTAINTGSGSMTQKTLIDRSFKQYIFHWKHGASLLWPSVAERNEQQSLRHEMPAHIESEPSVASQGTTSAPSEFSAWQNRSTNQALSNPNPDHHVDDGPDQFIQNRTSITANVMLPDASIGVPSPAFTLANDTGLIVISVYLWPTGNPHRGPDRLGDDILAPGEAFYINPDDGGCIYDIWIKLEESSQEGRWRELDLCKLVKITLNVDPSSNKFSIHPM